MDLRQDGGQEAEEETVQIIAGIQERRARGEPNMKRKLGISIISAWYALIGISMLLIAAGIGFGGTEAGIPEEIAAIGAGAFGIVALIALTLAYGIYNLEAWGWYAAVIINAICAISAIIQANICGLVIPAIIIWYLWVNQRDFRVSVNL